MRESEGERARARGRKRAREGERKILFFSHKDANSIMRTLNSGPNLNLITSLRLDLQIPSHWG